MALRNIDTDFYNKAFVRGLPGPYKALWVWLQLNCDHAGIWEVDIDIARMRTGFNDLDLPTAEELFKLKILVLRGGEKWFLLEYPESQFKTKELNPTNTYHWGAIVILQRLALMDNDFIVRDSQLEKAVKPLYSSSKAAKLNNIKYLDLSIKDKELKEEKKEPAKKVSKEKKPAENKFSNPLTEAFKEFRLMRERRKRPLTERAAQMIHTELTKLAGDNVDLKIAILNQSTKHAWLDVFPLKNKDANIDSNTNKVSKEAKVTNAIEQIEYRG